MAQACVKTYTRPTNSTSRVLTGSDIEDARAIVSIGVDGGVILACLIATFKLFEIQFVDSSLFSAHSLLASRRL
jgi:hypothetical protein